MNPTPCDREHVDPRAGIYFWSAVLISYFLLFAWSVIYNAYLLVAWIIDVIRYGCC